MALPVMIKNLLRREAYSESPSEVRLVQTHISYVIITDRFVYKIKKPVNFGFLDFTSLGKRHFYCRRELELNRRLSPDIYLDVVEIRKRGSEFHYNGKGTVADYAVKMKRLPEERLMLDLLKKGKIDNNMIDRVAATIADFHNSARTNTIIAGYGETDVIKKNMEENFTQTVKYIDKTISKDSYERIKRYAENFIIEKADLLLHRMKEGKIKDCHGDIHMEHVCIADKIYIYDCIEFNDRFRYGDVASDMAFLAMDLDFHGKPDLSRRFAESYAEAADDRDIDELVNFYKCYRAYIRGKVDSFEIDDRNLSVEEKEEAMTKARRYFDLALEYACR